MRDTRREYGKRLEDGITTRTKHRPDRRNDGEGRPIPGTMVEHIKARIPSRLMAGGGWDISNLRFVVSAVAIGASPQHCLPLRLETAAPSASAGGRRNFGVRNQQFPANLGRATGDLTKAWTRGIPSQEMKKRGPLHGSNVTGADGVGGRWPSQGGRPGLRFNVWRENR